MRALTATKLRAMAVEGGDLSVIGRLLEEISWEASRVTQYREGGRDLEDALTRPGAWMPRSRWP